MGGRKTRTRMISNFRWNRTVSCRFRNARAVPIVVPEQILNLGIAFGDGTGSFQVADERDYAARMKLIGCILSPVGNANDKFFPAHWLFLVY